MGLQIQFFTDELTPQDVAVLAAVTDVLRGDLDRTHASYAAHMSKAVAAHVATVTGATGPLVVDPTLAEGVEPFDPAVAFGEGPLGGAAFAPQSAPAVSPAGVDVDADGLPWDQRIHSGNREKTQTGHWRKRRGVDEATTANVVAELRQLMMGQSAPPPAPVTAPPPAPVTAPAAAPETPGAAFGRLMAVVGPAKNSGKINEADITSVLQPHGVAVLGLLMSRPDIIPAVIASFEAIIAERS